MKITIKIKNLQRFDYHFSSFYKIAAYAWSYPSQINVAV